jgi:hypothetical protein
MREIELPLFFEHRRKPWIVAPIRFGQAPSGRRARKKSLIAAIRQQGSPPTKLTIGRAPVWLLTLP